MACATSSSGWRVCLFHHVGGKSVEPAVGVEPTTCAAHGCANAVERMDAREPHAYKAAAWPAELSGHDKNRWVARESNPVCHVDGWFTASCSHQCCSLPNAIGADDGTRTHGLDVGDVAFCLTELHPRFE